MDKDQILAGGQLLSGGPSRLDQHIKQINSVPMNTMPFEDIDALTAKNDVLPKKRMIAANLSKIDEDEDENFVFDDDDENAEPNVQSVYRMVIDEDDDDEFKAALHRAEMKRRDAAAEAQRIKLVEQAQKEWKSVR